MTTQSAHDHRYAPHWLSERKQLELDIHRFRDRALALAEQNRVLRLANQSLGAGVAPQMAELLAAARAWRAAIDPARPDGVAAAERRLLAAIAAVEDVHG
jgi:hypothetical protein